MSCWYQVFVQYASRVLPSENVDFNSPRTVLLHDREELDDDLRAWSNQDLALASLLGVVDSIERIVQDTGADHVDEWKSVLK